MSFIHKYFNVFAISTLFIVFLLNLVKLQEPAHFKFGDSQSLSLSMVAGKKFADEGFLHHKFNPRFQKQSNNECCDYQYYTHFPQLTNILSGTFYKAGLKSLPQVRLAYAFIVFVSIILLYFLIQYFLGKNTAFLACLFILLNKIFWMLSTHQVYDLSLIFSYGALLMAVLSQSKKNIFLIWVCLFFNLLSSFEYVVSTHIILFGLSLINEKTYKDIILKNFIWGSASIASFIFKFLINSTVIGGFQAAFQDKLDTLKWRTNEAARGTSYLDTILGDQGYIEYLLRHFIDYYFYSGPALIAVLISLFFYRSKEMRKNLFILCISFSVLSWNFIFKQHSVIHINTLVIRYLLPVVGIICAFLLVKSFQKLRETSNIKSKIANGAIFILSLMIWNYNLRSYSKAQGHFTKNTFSKELILLKEKSSNNDKLCTDDKNLMRAKYLHMPEESFGMQEFKLRLVSDQSECSNEIFINSQDY